MERRKKLRKKGQKEQGYRYTSTLYPDKQTQAHKATQIFRHIYRQKYSDKNAQTK